MRSRADGTLWCPPWSRPYCNYRARIRLGVPRWDALAILEHEKSAA